MKAIYIKPTTEVVALYTKDDIAGWGLYWTSVTEHWTANEDTFFDDSDDDDHDPFFDD